MTTHFARWRSWTRWHTLPASRFRVHACPCDTCRQSRFCLHQTRRVQGRRGCTCTLRPNINLCLRYELLRPWRTSFAVRFSLPYCSQAHVPVQPLDTTLTPTSPGTASTRHCSISHPRRIVPAVPLDANAHPSCCVRWSEVAGHAGHQSPPEPPPGTCTHVLLNESNEMRPMRLSAIGHCLQDSPFRRLSRLPCDAKQSTASTAGLPIISYIIHYQRDWSCSKSRYFTSAGTAMHLRIRGPKRQHESQALQTPAAIVS